MISGAKTILVVEDSVTQVLHLQSLLEQEGAKVVLAVDGEMGLALSRSLQPDLVILDLQMPRMNGIEVVRSLKEDPETAEIPIVIFSAHAEEGIQEWGAKTGVEFIPKDAFADAVLLETLRQMGIISAE